MAIEIVEFKDGLALLTLVIVGAYIGNVLSCDVQRMLTHNILAKHITAFVCAFFAVSLTLNKKNTLTGYFKSTFIVYTIYIMTTKAKLPFVLPTMVLLLVDQVLKVSNDLAEENEGAKNSKIEAVRNVITYVVFGCVAVGFAQYYLRARREFGDKFSFAKFMVGTTKCQGL